MGEANRFDGAGNEDQAATSELVQAFLNQIGYKTDLFRLGGVDPKSEDAKFGLNLTVPTHTDSETGDVVDTPIPQARLEASDALRQLRLSLGADNIDGRQEETLDTDLSGNPVEVVWWNALVSANPATNEPYASPVAVTVKETHPAENYPDDLLGITATVTLANRPPMPAADIVLPQESQPNS